MIHILEQNGIEQPESKYSRFFKAAIKCHHNKIANYIQINLFDYNINIKIASLLTYVPLKSR